MPLSNIKAPVHIETSSLYYESQASSELPSDFNKTSEQQSDFKKTSSDTREILKEATSTIMALLPYLFDDIRPRRLRDQLFGMDLLPTDFLLSEIERPAINVRRYLRPWRNLAAIAQDVGSTIKSDKDKFQVNLDVQHFSPEEISVKTSDGYVVVEGKHEERKDEHGFISRQFKRRYALPEGCNPETVESKLSSDGVLSIIAPKHSENKDERAIPITQTGPVRRKVHEDHEEEEANGEAKEEEKSPQKKRRR